MSAALPFDRFVQRQRWTDVVVNIILIAVPNYFLLRHETAIPLWCALGDIRPALMGSLVTIALLLSFLLTFIVFGVTVAQRKAGKIAPPLAAETKWAGAALVLALKHVGLVFVPMLLLAILLSLAGVQRLFSPSAVIVIITCFGAFLAYVESAWTTRATLNLHPRA